MEASKRKAENGWFISCLVSQMFLVKITKGELYLALAQVQMEQMETRKRDWTRLVEHSSSVAPLTLPTCSNLAS